MNTMKRQLLFGMCLSACAFLFAAVIFFFFFPLHDWSLLWKKEIINVPLVVFVPVVVVLIGIGAGFLFGLQAKKGWQLVLDMLSELEAGKNVDTHVVNHSVEIEAAALQIKKIQNQMIEQKKLTQKLANESAETKEKRIQEIVSEERHRLARELHDSVSQELFAASMLMSAINESKLPLNEQATRQLKMVEEAIHQSQLEMRALLLHLRPAALKGKSLQEGMEDLLVELSQKVPMMISWKIEQIPLEKGMEDHLFRILQESVSNTLRHARATNLEVLLIKRDEFVILRVEDDGIGFDVEKTKAGSYGLQNMYERAIEIGGMLKIVSVKNKGTRLEVKVPIITAWGDEDD